MGFSGVRYLYILEMVRKSGVVMKLSCMQRRRAGGLTLIEVVIATTVIAIAAIGTLSYEYHGVKQMQIAKAHSGAVRIGYFLLEDWKANGGNALYATNSRGVTSPDDLDMGFRYIGGKTYKVTVNNIPMRVTLSRPLINSTLIPLTATVRWRRDFRDEAILPTDPSIVLNAHARADQAGG